MCQIRGGCAAGVFYIRSSFHFDGKCYQSLPNNVYQDFIRHLCQWKKIIKSCGCPRAFSSTIVRRITTKHICHSKLPAFVLSVQRAVECKAEIEGYYGSEATGSLNLSGIQFLRIRRDRNAPLMFDQHIAGFSGFHFSQVQTKKMMAKNKQ